MPMIGLGLGLALHKGGGVLYPVLGAMPSPPTAAWTGSGTTSISSAVSVARNSGKWRYLMATQQHASTFWQPSPYAGEDMVMQTMESGSDVVDIRQLHSLCKFHVRVEYPDYPALSGLVSSTAFTRDASGASDILKLDFSATPQPSARKKITIDGFNMLFGGIYVKPTFDGALPTPNRQIAVVFTDSYGDHNADGVATSAMKRALQALGYDVYIAYKSGMGYLSTSSDAPDTRATAVLSVLPYAPSLIVFALGFNDAGGNMTTLATNHAATVAAAAAAQPGATIATLGPWTPLGSTANLTLVNNALIASCAGLGRPFVDIADIINAGNAATYTDADNIHPKDQAAHTFLGNAIAQRMLARGYKVAVP